MARLEQAKISLQKDAFRAICWYHAQSIKAAHAKFNITLIGFLRSTDWLGGEADDCGRCASSRLRGTCGWMGGRCLG